MKINSYGNEYDLHFVRSEYANNGSLYVGAICSDGEPFCDVTVNLDESQYIRNPKAAYLDTNNSANVISEMIEEGYVVIDETDGAESGFCYYPLGVFTDKFFEEERYGAD